MQFLQLAGRFMQQGQQAARLLGSSIQEVVEILQPGALGSTAARWDAGRRSAANEAVEQAMQNWKHLQQELDSAQTEQQLSREQHQQLYEQRFLSEQVTEEPYQKDWQQLYNKSE